MIGKLLTAIFGPSYRTTLFGIIIGGSGLGNIFRLGRYPTEAEWILYVGIILWGYHQKDKDVTGGV